MRDGWQTAPFEACVESVTYTRKILRKDFRQSGRYPVVSQERNFINGYWDDEADLFRVEDPVVVFGDHTKVLKFVDFDFVLGADGVKILRPKPFLVPKFFFYQLLGAKLEALGYARHYRLLKELSISWPSQAEQQRIVGVLDEAIESVGRARSDVSRSLDDVSELFRSALETAFADRGMRVVPIGDVADVFDGPHATPKTTDSGPIFLGIAALQDGEINLGDTRHVTADDFKQWTRRVKPRAGDVVFSYETRLGQAAIIPDGLECCLGRRMGLVRVNRDCLDPRFFVQQYISPPFRRFLESRTIHGATVDRISISDFPSFPIMLPPLDEQRHLADQLAQTREQTQVLACIYESKLALLDELQQSLLQAAFSGSL